MKHLTAGYVAERQWSVARAHWYLRGVDAFGRGVRMRGSAFVQNSGRIVLGDRICFYPGPTAVELTAHPGGVLDIGDETHINYGSSFNASSSVRIGRRCLFGISVIVLDSHLHCEAVDRRHARPEPEPVEIEDDVWIASRAIILPGVRIGRGSIVGAGSVVTRSVPPGVLVAGSPARVLRAIHDGDRTGAARMDAGDSPPSEVGSRRWLAPDIAPVSGVYTSARAGVASAANETIITADTHGRGTKRARGGAA